VGVSQRRLFDRQFNPRNRITLNLTVSLIIAQDDLSANIKQIVNSASNNHVVISNQIARFASARFVKISACTQDYYKIIFNIICVIEIINFCAFALERVIDKLAYRDGNVSPANLLISSNVIKLDPSQPGMPTHGEHTAKQWQLMYDDIRLRAGCRA